MSFRNFKGVSYRVGGRHRSATTKIYGDKTCKGSKLLIGYCSICNRKKCLTLRDNTIQAEGLSDVFRNRGIKGQNVSKKMAKNVLKNPRRFLNISANVATAAASRNPKNVITALPDVINFYQTGSAFYLGRFV